MKITVTLGFILKTVIYWMQKVDMDLRTMTSNLEYSATTFPIKNTNNNKNRNTATCFVK